MRIFAIIAALFFTQLSIASETTPEIRAVYNEEMQMPHIGFAVGTSSPDAGFDAGGVYSLEYGLQPIVPFSYAVKATYAGYSDAADNFNRTSLTIEGKYNFGGTIPVVRHSYVGIGVGPAWESGSVDDEGLALVFYPQAGFDLPLESIVQAPISFGLNANYLVASRSLPDTFNLTGVIKYWY